ncbi:MAG: hypothetical protein K1X72_10355 [Pyrinomonadaceae bacterium]|nr:hypothetical protein [Pyrinomonadaceae bacterium]
MSSREKDLIDLIKTTNEIYLINPSDNARTAYIQIDDLCELMIKSYLDINVQNWSPISHQRNGRDYFKGFWAITSEIRAANNNAAIDTILTRMENRRDNRNQFFHNHNWAGLTVTNENCLQAFCDLYDLLNGLFPNAVNNNRTFVLLAQMGAIRVLRDCFINPDTRIRYNNIVKNWEHFEGKKSLKTKGQLLIEFPNLGFEYCVIHYFSQRFYDALIQANLITP